jgi:hypothetical protein
MFSVPRTTEAGWWAGFKNQNTASAKMPAFLTQVANI